MSRTETMSPNRRIFVSLAFLSFLAFEGCRRATNLSNRYDLSAELQEARMRCEAGGGYFGAAKRGERERCHERRAPR